TEHEAQRTGHRLRDDNDQLVLEEGAEARAPHDERGVFRAARSAGAKSWSWIFSIGGSTGRTLPAELAGPFSLGGSKGPALRVEMSEPAMLTIPIEGPLDPVAQADARRVADFLPRTRDVERAALRVEVDAPPVDRRSDSERYANRLADGTGRPERPYRKMEA